MNNDSAWDDDEIVSAFSPETGRNVYGPCPACGNWQLDAPYLEDHGVIAAILREHDSEAHPGMLDQLVTPSQSDPT